MSTEIEPNVKCLNNKHDINVDAESQNHGLQNIKNSYPPMGLGTRLLILEECPSFFSCGLVRVL